MSLKEFNKDTSILLENAKAAFYGVTMFHLEVVEDETCETAWTNGKKLGFNPEYYKSLTSAKRRGLQVHEISHPMFLHHTRRGNRDPVRWNIACDFAINPGIVQAGFELPDGGLIDRAYFGMEPEEIYELLPDEQGDKQDPGGCGEVRDADSEGDSDPQHRPQPMSPAEQRQEQDRWRRIISQAKELSQGKAGQLSSDAQQQIDRLIKPRISLEALLWQYANTCAKNDYSWNPPNRTYMQQDIYMPGVKSEELDPFIVAIDTSGSRNAKVLSASMAELSAVLERYDTKATILYCDSRIQGEVKTYGKQDTPIEIDSLPGGGGTAFTPVFEWVEKEGLMPSFMIYFTDLECDAGDYPKHHPGYPVLWITDTDSYRRYYREPPFGEVFVV
jgi:predicted metal-dependent peptidase